MVVIVSITKYRNKLYNIILSLRHEQSPSIRGTQSLHGLGCGIIDRRRPSSSSSYINYCTIETSILLHTFQSPENRKRLWKIVLWKVSKRICNFKFLLTYCIFITVRQKPSRCFMRTAFFSVSSRYIILCAKHIAILLQHGEIIFICSQDENYSY